jgi:hypothetical protein
MAGRLWDPTGARYGVPTYPWRMAPDGFATRRQLRVSGLRPGGQHIAAQVLWYSRRYWSKGTSPIRVAYLYRIDLAKPVRPMTPAKWAALARRMPPVVSAPSADVMRVAASRPRSACA